jgi:hypothetical protein
MINRIKKYIEPPKDSLWDKLPKTSSLPPLSSSNPVAEGYRLLAEDQTLLIAEMEEIIRHHKKVMKAQTVKIQKLIGYIERILGRKLNAPKNKKDA